MQKICFIIVFALILQNCQVESKKNIPLLPSDCKKGIELKTYKVIWEWSNELYSKYFDNKTISRNNIKKCVVIQGKINSGRVAKTVLFDALGNEIFEDNDYFWDWDGTHLGIYNYWYDS